MSRADLLVEGAASAPSVRDGSLEMMVLTLSECLGMYCALSARIDICPYRKLLFLLPRLPIRSVPGCAIYASLSFCFPSHDFAQDAGFDRPSNLCTTRRCHLQKLYGTCCSVRSITHNMHASQDQDAALDGMLVHK